MQPYYARDGVSLYHGDCLAVLPELAVGSFDALVTDPPYSSGGLTIGERQRDPGEKYVHHGVRTTRGSFTGDNRAGRSWSFWSTLWLGLARELLRPLGYALVFTDWRQLPSLTDALQAGGLTWRGIIAWDKTRGARAPHPGYFRHQCEYLVWGTHGPCAPIANGGPWDGCYTLPVRQGDKHHLTGKPTPLLRALLRCIPPGGLVLDPFAGSGTTLVAAWELGRRAVGVELDERYCEIAARVDRSFAPAASRHLLAAAHPNC